MRNLIEVLGFNLNVGGICLKLVRLRVPVYKGSVVEVQQGSK